MAKGCELCGKAARMYCESDEASLCWDCDEKVHGANFLVARHERTLLCQVCRSLTPWKSSGPKLCPTVSVCEACVNNNNSNECQRGQVAESQESINDRDEDDDDSDSDDEDGDYSSDEDEEHEEEEEEEEGENQVVPWSCASSPPPQPPPLSSTSSEEEEEEEKEELSSTAFSTLKRARVNADLDSDVCVFSFFFSLICVSVIFRIWFVTFRNETVRKFLF